MSSSQTRGPGVTPHTVPRDAAPVYRCGDSHWHFIPHDNDYSILKYPWYRRKKASRSLPPLPSIPKPTHSRINPKRALIRIHTNKQPSTTEHRRWRMALRSARLRARRWLPGIPGRGELRQRILQLAKGGRKETVVYGKVWPGGSYAVA